MQHFYTGLHQENHAVHFDRAFISVNRLWRPGKERRSPFPANNWILDCAGFTEIASHGEYRKPVAAYADEVMKWAACGKLVAAVSQDYMCEPFMLRKTGLTVRDHQRKTFERYSELYSRVRDVYIMPVLQGYTAQEYLDHLRLYEFPAGSYVGVGSVCKRNASPDAVVAVLDPIKSKRPDLKLHGFGLKVTALQDVRVRRLLHSSDSIAWSFAARWEPWKGNANDWRVAKAYTRKIERLIELDEIDAMREQFRRSCAVAYSLTGG